MRRPLIWSVAALLVGAGAWHSWTHRSAHPPAGVIAPDAPLQTPIEGNAAPIRHGHYTLLPRARFHVVARVLSREDYHLDAGADLAPTDLALGWGPMSDTAVIEQLTISQGARFFLWRARRLPLPRRQIEVHAGNMHIIPADGAVARQLARVRVGQLVRLDGELVDARRADGWHWNTSLTRTDTGAGACELVWVTALDAHDAGRAELE